MSEHHKGDESSSSDIAFSFGKVEGFQNVTIQVGSTAYLHCPVLNLGLREVNIFTFVNRSLKRHFKK
jgi:hypothetical protein